jgi:hypothetical protein
MSGAVRSAPPFVLIVCLTLRFFGALPHVGHAVGREGEGTARGREEDTTETVVD